MADGSDRLALPSLLSERSGSSCRASWAEGPAKASSSLAGSYGATVGSETTYSDPACAVIRPGRLACQRRGETIPLTASEKTVSFGGDLGGHYCARIYNLEPRFASVVAAEHAVGERRGRA